MSWIMVEYLCPEHGRFESLEVRPAPSSRACECGSSADLAVSAVSCKMPYGEIVARGENDERPPGVPNTEKLADGMSYSDWKKERKAGRADEHRKAAGIERQVYV